MGNLAPSPRPDRVLVSCVADNRPHDAREVLLLFTSLRRFGGALAGCRARACFVERADPALVSRLAALGVESKVLPRVDARCPPANKIRMVEAAGDIDWLVALDTDIAVAGDITAHLRGAAVRAKPVDRDPLGPVRWRSLFDHFAVGPPAGRFLTTFDRAATTAYFNSGVLFVPGAVAAALAKAWKSFVGPVLDACRDLPALAPHAYFTDQLALTLALARLGLDVDPLPPALNFPTHWPVHPGWRPDDLDPLVLHHHHRLTPAGGLERCGHRGPDAAIDRVNAALCAP